MAENAPLNTAESDFMSTWQQAMDEGTVTSATENMRRAQAFARGAELSLADVAERYQATGNADAAASASEAASQCRLAIDSLHRAQQTAAG